MPNRHPNVAGQESNCLVVVDVQERFRPLIEDFDAMVAGSIRLVRTFQALSIPILVTEQYPRGLGETVAELRDVLGTEWKPSTKTCFSSCGSDDVSSRLSELRAHQAVVCGIEAQVCVNQTVHDLLQRGMAVHVAVDAVGSRKALDKSIALRKMERSGAILTTTEAIAFELMEDARHPKFKEVQALFK